MAQITVTVRVNVQLSASGPPQHRRLPNYENWAPGHKGMIDFFDLWENGDEYRTTGRKYRIYRTPMAQTMELPVWEPPDSDVLVEYMDEKEWKRLMECVRLFSSDPTKRYDYLDELLEKEALGEYHTWTTHALLAALTCGDKKRITFYSALERTVLEDLSMAEEEFEAKDRARLADDSSDKEELEGQSTRTSLPQPPSAKSSTSHGHQLNPAPTVDPRPPAQMKRRSCCILL